MTIRRFALAALVATWVAGCPKKEAPVVGAPPPPPAPEPTPPAVTELAPLEDDSGPPVDAATEAGKKWHGGAAANANQVKIKECSNAIGVQAKVLGTSTEAFQLTALSLQCD